MSVAVVVLAPRSCWVPCNRDSNMVERYIGADRKHVGVLTGGVVAQVGSRASLSDFPSIQNQDLVEAFDGG